MGYLPAPSAVLSGLNTYNAKADGSVEVAVEAKMRGG